MEDASLVTDGACTEDAVLEHEGDADDKARVLPKTSFDCFRMGGEPAASAPDAIPCERMAGGAGHGAGDPDIDAHESAHVGASDCTVPYRTCTLYNKIRLKGHVTS